MKDKLTLLYVLAIQVAAGERQKLQPAYGLADDALLDFTFDGEHKTDIDNCYVQSWHNVAKLVMSIGIDNRVRIQEVSLLNSDDQSSRMDGIEVSVCDETTRCTLCGISQNPGASKWARIQCEGEGILGNQIELVNKNDVLQFCEVEVVGYHIIKECKRCLDYHPLCRAVIHPEFYEEYKNNSGDAETPAAFKSCDDPFYKYFCPLSCVHCKPC